MVWRLSSEVREIWGYRKKVLFSDSFLCLFFFDEIPWAFLGVRYWRLLFCFFLLFLSLVMSGTRL